jgi:hypothetical protein
MSPHVDAGSCRDSAGPGHGRRGSRSRRGGDDSLRGGEPLLGRGGLVIDENLVDDGLEWAELGSRPVPGQGLGMGVGMPEGMPDGLSRVSKLAGDLPDGPAIAMSPPNRAMVVHGHHVRALRGGEAFSAGTFTIPEGAGVGPTYALILPPGGCRLGAQFQLFHPRRHKWHRHGRREGPVLIRLTPSGRATVAVLEINLDYRIAFR